MLLSLRPHLALVLAFLLFAACSSGGRSSGPIGLGLENSSSSKTCWERASNCGGRLSTEVYRRHRDHLGGCRWNVTGAGGSGGEYRGYGGTFFTECWRCTPNDANADGSFAKGCGRP